MMKLKQIMTLTLVGLISALAAVGIYKATDKSPQAPLVTEANTTISAAKYAANKENVPFDFTTASDRGLPAVVHIRSTINGNRQQESSSRRIPFEDLFGDLFGSPRGDDSTVRPGMGFGSGVVISADGYIITNNHVIENADDLNVTLFNNKEYKAELIGADPLTDIALIKIKGSNFSYIPFANSDNLKIGEWVVAIGNPSIGDAYTLRSSVTAGIVSAVGRDIGINPDDLALESFIQTDAVINRGNSGGALVDVSGNLVGINTAISSETGFYNGYGFAVPSNLVKRVITDLKNHGEVKRALLGVQYNDIVALRNRGGELDTNETEGLYIAVISEGGSADKAGLKVGDVLLKVDGKNVTGGRQNKLQEIIGSKRPGENVQVEFKRDGKLKNLSVKLMSIEDIESNYAKAVGLVDIDKLGIEIRNLKAQELQDFGVKGGVRIESVDTEGAIYENNMGTAIEEGFIVQRINDIEVKDAQSVQRALAANNNFVKIDGFHERSPNSSHSVSFQLGN